MTLHLHTLAGCAPAPLAHYLKALGILRLLVEQHADPAARGWWQGEHFRLLTKLSREEIETFFLERYAPTPLLSPWNKGCGFFKENDPGLAPLENSTAPRFQSFREGVRESRQLLDTIDVADTTIRAIKARTKTNKSFQTEQQRHLLADSDIFHVCLTQLGSLASKPDLAVEKREQLHQEIKEVKALVATASKPPTKAEAERIKSSAGYKRLLAAAERKFKALKATLLSNCRLLWRGPHAQWLAAAVVLDEDGKASWPSLFGTGGTDGRLDFTNNFMQQLGCLFDIASPQGSPNKTARALLANAMWSEPANQLTNSAVGQYQPGAAGGANSSTGSSGESIVNAWDFILMMEGSLLFSAQATRRLDPQEFSRASAPFAVRSHAAGYASPGSEKAQRGEQWMPIWSRPATLADVQALFGEARVQLKRQTANRPVDVARAVSRLGVARGIEAFTRYGYLERNGQSTLAVPLGRIDVRENIHAHLIDDLAPWLDRLQRRARDKHATARQVQLERRLTEAVFAALTHDPTPERWQAILRAAAAVEMLQASGSAIEAGPIPGLRPEWIAAIDDQSVDVRLAVALGSAAAAYSRQRSPIDPVRHHWLPLDKGALRFKTSDKRLQQDTRVVMTGRDPIADCAAIVQRRLLEADMQGHRCLPLVAARRCGARLSDLAALLSGAVDLRKVLELARALMAVKWRQWEPSHALPLMASDDQPGEAWLTLRLACLPSGLLKGLEIPAEPNIARRLLAGDSAGATSLAVRRLWSAGIRPPLQAGATDAATARLWAAALAFPIDRHSAERAVAILDPTKKGSFDA